MALQYFIDGYNLLHTTDKWGAGPMPAQRERMIRFIEEARPGGSNAVTVVFDGHPANVSSLRPAFARLLFSMDQDADTVIKDLVDQHANARNIIVVTNDRAIQKWVQGAGAKVLSCEEFLLLAPRSLGEGGKARKRALDASAANAINAELKKLWGVK